MLRMAGHMYKGIYKSIRAWWTVGVFLAAGPNKTYTAFTTPTDVFRATYKKSKENQQLLL